MQTVAATPLVGRALRASRLRGASARRDGSPYLTARTFMVVHARCAPHRLFTFLLPVRVSPVWYQVRFNDLAAGEMAPDTNK